jgi:anaerobic magnesium-protoporphyrin IX monomethyl ester cyclase
MKVQLIYPNITDYPIDISHGLASISAMLKKHGHQVGLIDCTFNKSIKKLLAEVHNFRPDVIGIPAASNDFNYAVEICSHIKKHFNIPIICGGFHATMAPEEVIAKDCFDIVVIGEGEFTILEVLDHFKELSTFDGIVGIWYKEDGGIKKNNLRLLNSSIEELPFPDKGLFDYQRYININRGLGTFITSYGCPHECSYCINKPLMDKFGKKGFVRYKPIPYLIEEIKSVIENYRIREIEFYDDTFTLNKSRIREFCEIYPHIIGLPFYVNSRVDTLDEELLRQLKEAGCIRISMGIESGDPYIRNEVLKRNHSDDQIIQAFHLVKSLGMQTLSYNIVGVPYENKESIKKTIDLNQKCKPDFVAVSIFNAYQGTEMHQLCKKNDWLLNDLGQAYFQTSNIKHPAFSLNELKRIRNNFGYNIFKTYNYKRALIDYFDKKLLKNRIYQNIRSFFIKSGIKKFL